VAGADSSSQIEVLAADALDQIRPMMLDLLVEDQSRYSHRLMTREEIDRDLLGAIEPRFEGENVILAHRVDGEIAGLCWCVVFDPGTGREGEVAEVYVRPEFRGQGLARGLLRRAIELFRERGVTFATVWTHAGNEPAVRLYREAGFSATEQLVLTWLPESD
jgi:ribosomal protein S18 acetylase RimI-like enzyme